MKVPFIRSRLWGILNYLGEKMSVLIKLVSTVVVLSSVATMSLSDPIPKGAKKASPQTVANFYVGKSQTWRSCKGGGIYRGGNWKAEAFCQEKGNAIGIGTWSVSANGRICHDLTWYWSEDGRVRSVERPVTDEHCDDIVQAPDGTLWARWVKEKKQSDAWCDQPHLSGPI